MKKPKKVARVTNGKTNAPRNGGGKKGGETMVEFTPEHTVPLTLNGRTIDVHGGVKTKVPPEYHAIYLASR